MFEKEQRNRLKIWGLSNDAILELEATLPICRAFNVPRRATYKEQRKLFSDLEQALRLVINTLKRLGAGRGAIEIAAFYRLIWGMKKWQTLSDSRPRSSLPGSDPKDLYDFATLDNLEFLHRTISLELEYGIWKHAPSPKYQIQVSVIADILQRHEITTGRNDRFVNIVSECLAAIDSKAKADAETAVRAYLKRDAAAPHRTRGSARKKGPQAS
jgi:hypothetical protein